MIYYRDRMRHLVCIPYSVENLHKMAEDLGIKRCWFHAGTKPHYDIPKRRVDEIAKRSNCVSSRVILKIVQGSELGPGDLPEVTRLPAPIARAVCWCGDVGCDDH